ncbi:MAG: hypothetical protein V1899_06595 [Planctomycetota bacterium]
MAGQHVALLVSNDDDKIDLIKSNNTELSLFESNDNGQSWKRTSTIKNCYNGTVSIDREDNIFVASCPAVRGLFLRQGSSAVQMRMRAAGQKDFGDPQIIWEGTPQRGITESDRPKMAPVDGGMRDSLQIPARVWFCITTLRAMAAQRGRRTLCLSQILIVMTFH